MAEIRLGRGQRHPFSFAIVLFTNRNTAQTRMGGKILKGDYLAFIQPPVTNACSNTREQQQRNQIYQQLRELDKLF